MSMTDPIADLLTRIRNAQMAEHQNLILPRSRIKVEIVKILKDEGYVADFRLEEGDKQGTIHIELKSLPNAGKAIAGLKRVSRPGRRVYCSKDEIPKVLNGLGITIISTSKGIFSGTSCRRQGVGGEVLCNIW